MLSFSSPAAVRNFPFPQSSWSIAGSGLSSDFDDKCPEEEDYMKVNKMTQHLLKVIADMIQGVSEKSVFFEICILSLRNVSKSDFIPKSS